MARGTGTARTAEAGSGGSLPTSPSVMDVAQFAVDGATICETSVGSDGRLGGSFGILSEPVASVPAAVCLVFLNAGAIRRIGPNRMWVEAARRWAAKGVRAARVDVAGIGDAEGDPGMYADVGRFYTPDREALVTTILDDLEGRGWGPRFILIGLCAGAYSAFNTAAIDDRVIGVLAFNPKILVWDPDLLARRDALLVTRILEPGSWRRILHGETPISRIVEIGWLAVGRATSAVIRVENTRTHPGCTSWRVCSTAWQRCAPGSSSRSRVTSRFTTRWMPPECSQTRTDGRTSSRASSRSETTRCGRSRRNWRAMMSSIRGWHRSSPSTTMHL